MDSIHDTFFYFGKRINVFPIQQLYLTHSKEIKLDKTIFYFLIAYWIYIDGVDTVIRMAINYGLTIGFDSTDLLIALLVTQFVAFKEHYY